MTDQKGHPVPSQELKQQWWEKAEKEHEDYWYEHAADSAAAWSADRELEACCEWLLLNGWGQAINGLRAARRPKPPSIKRQAFDALDAYIYGNPDSGDKQRTYNTIRRALEALDD